LDTARAVMQSRLTLLFYAVLTTASIAAGESQARYLSPAALAVSPDAKTVYVACSTAGEVLAVDVPSRGVRQRYTVPGFPSGLVVAPDAKQLLVTCAAARSSLRLLDTRTGECQRSIPLGHTAMSPVFSRDASTVYVCYRFENCVGVIDLSSGKEMGRVPVVREPVAAALSKDGRHLFVANHLQNAAADGDIAASSVTVIDCLAARVIKQIMLPNGSTAVNDVCISPDGKHAVVTHIVARFQIPAAQLERGWMNTNAKTIIDVERMEILDTVLLDDVDHGAATPWGMAWTRNGEKLVVAHAGTHELSLIDFPALLRKIRERRGQLASPGSADPALEPVNDLAFLGESRRRVSLPIADRGPRAVAVAGSVAVSANYFSDSLTLVDLNLPRGRAETIRLGPAAEMDEVRRGEFYFHDAGICFQGWQSCATCHPGEGRTDGLNWDLLNDGIGNPKNTKSLLLSHRTPPAMSMGVRETAETAVRAGIRNILMTVQPESIARSIDAYLKSLRPQPSPRLADGKLSAAAVRGERAFRKANCSACHPKESLFTDLQSYDVGTRSGQDRQSEQFDTPSLVEVWRTAPYLHDGSAATIREVLTTRNQRDEHGVTSTLSEQEMADLCEYVLSL